MDIRTAERIARKYRVKPSLNEDEEFEYTESLNYLIEETKDPEYMVELGSYYYGLKKFDLALKYYEMAHMCGDVWAAEGLGYIWYYGRTGVTDYEKAFHYYSKAAENGNFRSMIKVADMYKNGYYVEKDYARYVETIEKAKKEVEHTRSPGAPFSEIYTRLAAIRKEQGRKEEAADLYLDARDFLAQRIRYTGFFGDFNVMKWATEDLYSIIEFDQNDFGFYDLYYLFTKPCTVTFRYEGKKYTASAVDTENGIAVHFGEQRFKDVDAFFAGAKIGTEMLYVIYNRLYDFEVTA